LYKVYASTRADEMAQVPWSAEQKRAFLDMQYNAQRQHYLAHYPTAAWLVIQQGDAPIGRMIVERSAGEILLMDIALLPEQRNAGIGSGLVQDLMAEAGQAGKTVRLHVEFFNPALRLYERLGFVKIGEAGIYFEMEWRPTPGKGNQAA